MSNDVVVQVRMDGKTKAKAEKIFKRLGMSTSEAVRIFFAQTVEEKGIPFRPHIPNAATRRALVADVEPMGEGDLVEQWDNPREVYTKQVNSNAT